MSIDRKQQLRQLTECSICYSKLLDPRILPCGHTFCGTCIAKLSEQCRSQNTESIECAECRQKHSVNHSLPIDFRLKQVVEAMDSLWNESTESTPNDPLIVPEKSTCRKCETERDGGEFFVCETCVDDPTAKCICSLCVVKYHRPHAIKSVMQAMQAFTTSTMATNKHLIDSVLENSEFFFKRYDVQKEQVIFVFRSLATFCETTKERIETDFNREDVELANSLNGFLSVTFDEMNSVLNDADNLIFAMCMKILTNLEQHFSISREAMEHFKQQLIHKETIDFNTLLEAPAQYDTPTERSNEFTATVARNFACDGGDLFNAALPYASRTSSDELFPSALSSHLPVAGLQIPSLNFVSTTPSTATGAIRVTLSPRAENLFGRDMPPSTSRTTRVGYGTTKLRQQNRRKH